MKTFADFGIQVPNHVTGEYQTTCPECSPRRKKKRVKCLSVNTEKEVWICHHCGWSGGLGSSEYRPETLHWNKPVFSKPKKKPKSDLPQNVVDWFKARGISEQTLIDCKIGYDSVYMPQVEDFVNAIAFPYFRNEEHVNTKWRDGNKNFRLETNAERILYGLNDIEDADTVIWVEGEIDKLSMWEAGFKNCVSVPDGAPAENADNYSSKFTWLSSCENWLTGKKHVLAVDSDGPGKKLADELSRRLGRASCFTVEWPHDCKDANEVISTYTVDVLKMCVEHPMAYPIEGVFSTLDMSQKILNLYNNGLEKGVSTGWESLDELFLPRAGEFTVVTGIPNSGKSNFVDDLFVHLAEKHGWRGAFFSPENQPLEDHMSRILEKHIKKPFNQGPTERASSGEIAEAINWCKDHFFWILPDDDADWSIDAVLGRVESLVYQHGIRMLIIDPWNELEQGRKSNENETDYISRALKKIRQFGRRMGVHIFIVVHPQKLRRDADGNYPVPTLYDCAGSAHWRNKADNGLCIWRDFSTPNNINVEIHVQKIRFRQNGKIGMCELAYNKVTATYHEPSKARQEIPADYWGYAS